MKDAPYIPDRREDLQQHEHDAPPLPRDSIGDDPGRQPEDAADAEPADEAQHHELIGIAGQSSRRAADGIDEHAQGEHARPAISIANATNDQPTEPPTDEEHGCRILGRCLHQQIRAGQRHQIGQRWNAREGEEPLIERIEQPGEGHHRKHEPLISGHRAPPGRWGLPAVFQNTPLLQSRSRAAMRGHGYL